MYLVIFLTLNVLYLSPSKHIFLFSFPCGNELPYKQDQSRCAAQCKTTYMKRYEEKKVIAEETVRGKDNRRVFTTTTAETKHHRGNYSCMSKYSRETSQHI